MSQSLHINTLLNIRLADLQSDYSNSSDWSAFTQSILMKEKHLELLTKNFEQAPWYWLYMDTMSAIKHSIDIQINCLDLYHTSSFDDVRSDVCITLCSLVQKKKLIFDQDAQVFTYIKKNGDQNQIANFRGWLRSVSINYLKKLREERNKINKFVDIDDYYVKNKVCTDIINDYLEREEIREKVNLLKKLDRRIVELCFFEGYKFDEISEKLEEEGLGIFTAVALRKRKSRALEKLRKHFLPKN